MTKSPPVSDLSAEEQWRLDKLLHLGFKRVHALDLLEHPDVAHDALELVTAGCDPSLAYRILRD